MNKSVESKLYRPAEAAAQLGVTVHTLREWHRAGKIHAVHTVGDHRRFPQAEIDRLLGRELPPTPAPYTGASAEELGFGDYDPGIGIPRTADDGLLTLLSAYDAAD